jgi:dipeptidyl-peptidase 4
MSSSALLIAGFPKLRKFDPELKTCSIMKLLVITATTLAILFLNFFALAQNEKKQITLEDIWVTGKFNPRGIQGLVSMRDGLHYTLRQSDSINQYRYDDGRLVQTILHAGLLTPEESEKPIRFTTYSFSPDESKILLATETERIYRYSRRSEYFVFDRKTEKLTPLSKNGKQRLADFSPDGSKVAFVRENNIFIADLQSDAETQITHDGLDRHIINGTTDWVYEEEFAITKGFHWSPDGNNIAFMRFDESHVKEFWMVNYGGLYPDHHKYKYPKAGEENSIVTIHIYNIRSGQTIEVDTGKEIDIYLPRMQWTNDPEKLAIQRMNRYQNHLEILLADAGSGKTSLLYEETNKYYIDITDDLTFLNDGKHFIITSERSGFNHIYLYDMRGNLVRPLTSGNWDVTGFYGVNPVNNCIFYQAAKASPMNREVYSVRLNGRGERKLSDAEGMSAANFSRSFDYFIGTWQSVTQPPYITVNNKDGKMLRILETNHDIKDLVAEYNFSPVEFFIFPGADDIELHGWMIKPPGFDPKCKYPVFMYVYGGPGSQTVMNNWGRATMNWFQLLAQVGYIVVSVDNRGTGARGEEFKKLTYLQLGKYESLDQIEAAKYLSSLPYVDSARIGIYGWSYGGYMALLCLTKGSEYFSAGIAVAPVTSWRFYDNIYTERYMRAPQENPDGYDDNSPINFTDQMEGSLLLVHGTGDDNVHVENTMEMIDALVKSNKQFDLMLYPNRDHGIWGGNTRLHLFQMMTDFVKKNL